MTTREKILESLTPVLRDSEHVEIRKEGVERAAKELLNEEIPAWDNDSQFLGTPEETAQYYFFIDSINFCFWAPKGEERWEYPVDGGWVGGYYAYSTAIKDAFLRNTRFFDAEYLSQISEEDFRSIFRAGRNELQEMDERLRIIRENFSTLRDRFGGQALNLLNEAARDADQIVSLLLKEFPSFNDSSEYNGETIFFLKRAQLFASDLSFTGLPELAIRNLENLTVFADYKLPQILEAMSVLAYGPELEADIANEELIPRSSRKELELRASTIAAIEQVREEMERLGRPISTHELDWMLWTKTRGVRYPKPHHRTLTTFY